ncbi:Heavy metal-associated isoprenylated plant protein 21 [Sarracenia purpurea var. burkii]
MLIIGVKSVEVNRKQSRVTVNGFVDPNSVLKKIKSTGKGAEFWPYIPYNLVYHPYVSQVYDKRAPAGYVRNVAQALPAGDGAAASIPPEERFTFLFSDDNPNACSIM